jgi:glutamate N-acetyltransferase/amino-acid N-acetyltransferase
LLAAAGSAGVEFEPERSFVAYGDTVVARGGVPVKHAETLVQKHMEHEQIDIEVGLGIGSGSARMIGIDLGPGYIKENVKTS